MVGKNAGFGPLFISLFWSEGDNHIHNMKHNFLCTATQRPQFKIVIILSFIIEVVIVTLFPHINSDMLSYLFLFYK